MKNMDRDRAAVAIAVCDQMEAALKDGDPHVIHFYRQHLQEWAAEADSDDMLHWVRCVRARALEILQGEECAGTEPE